MSKRASEIARPLPIGATTVRLNLSSVASTVGVSAPKRSQATPDGQPMRFVVPGSIRWLCLSAWLSISTAAPACSQSANDLLTPKPNLSKRKLRLPGLLEPVQPLVETTNFFPERLRFLGAEPLGARRARTERGGQGAREDSESDEGSHAHLLYVVRDRCRDLVRADARADGRRPSRARPGCLARGQEVGAGGARPRETSGAMLGGARNATPSHGIETSAIAARVTGRVSRPPVRSPLAANGHSSLTCSGSKKLWTRWGACAARNATKAPATSRLTRRRHALGPGRARAAISPCVYPDRAKTASGKRLSASGSARPGLRAAWP